jgi:hypothetical protein
MKRRQEKNLNWRVPFLVSQKPLLDAWRTPVHFIITPVIRNPQQAGRRSPPLGCSEIVTVSADSAGIGDVLLKFLQK